MAKPEVPKCQDHVPTSGARGNAKVGKERKFLRSGGGGRQAVRPKSAGTTAPFTVGAVVDDQ